MYYKVLLVLLFSFVLSCFTQDIAKDGPISAQIFKYIDSIIPLQKGERFIRLDEDLYDEYSWQQNSPFDENGAGVGLNRRWQDDCYYPLLEDFGSWYLDFSYDVKPKNSNDLDCVEYAWSLNDNITDWNYSLDPATWSEMLQNGSLPVSNYKINFDATIEQLNNQSVVANFTWEAQSLYRVNAAPSKWFVEGLFWQLRNASLVQEQGLTAWDYYINPKNGMLNAITTGFIVAHNIYTETITPNSVGTSSSIPEIPYIVAFIIRELGTSPLPCPPTNTTTTSTDHYK